MSLEDIQVSMTRREEGWCGAITTISRVSVKGFKESFVLELVGKHPSSSPAIVENQSNHVPMPLLLLIQYWYYD